MTIESVAATGRSQALSGAMPTPAGGAVEPGHYVLTSETVYGASSLDGYEPATVYQFDGQGNFSATGSFVGGTNPDDRATRGTWQTNGTTLNLLITCGCSRALAKCAPVKLPSHVEYTSTTGELVSFMDYVNGGVMVQRYAKR